MPEDISNNHALASGLARASAKLKALTEAGIAVRKVTVFNAEPAFMLGADEDAPEAPRRRR